MWDVLGVMMMIIGGGVVVVVRGGVNTEHTPHAAPGPRPHTRPAGRPPWSELYRG